MAPGSFWELTPFALGLLMEAYGDRMQAEYQARLWQTWHGEALHRVKKLPRLNEVLRPGKAARRTPKGPEELDRILFAAAAAR